jgi:UDP-N-acetylglucosamine acyltransferase
VNSKIHPTAIIEEGAVIAPDVEIGAYAYIGKMVRIGSGTIVQHHATVDGNTELGSGNNIYPYAFVGAKTQDLKYTGGEPGLRIGDRNTFREYCSVHSATEESNFTTIGSDNNFLAYTHIAHDCVLGNHIVTSNNCGIAGHVVIGDHVVMGGYAGVHQFCHVGDYVMVGAMSKVVQDVAPFVIVEGNPAETRTINKVGLERNGFDANAMSQVKLAYKILFRSELPREQAIAKLRELVTPDAPIVEKVIKFVEASQRGVC